MRWPYNAMRDPHISYKTISFRISHKVMRHNKELKKIIFALNVCCFLCRASIISPIKIKLCNITNDPCDRQQPPFRHILR